MKNFIQLLKKEYEAIFILLAIFLSMAVILQYQNIYSLLLASVIAGLLGYIHTSGGFQLKSKLIERCRIASHALKITRESLFAGIQKEKQLEKEFELKIADQKQIASFYRLSKEKAERQLMNELEAHNRSLKTLEETKKELEKIKAEKILLDKRIENLNKDNVDLLEESYSAYKKGRDDKEHEIQNELENEVAGVLKLVEKA